MHAVSHSLPHRGPGASRARARWQPYSSTVTLPFASASTPSRSPASYLHTPASSVSSSSPPTVYLNPVCDPDRFKSLSLHLSQPSTTTLRDVQKVRYVTRLVDQAVKSLSDIWRPDDIPLVFSAPAPSVDPTFFHRDGRFGPVTSHILTTRNTQLPSPVSPSTRPSPFPASPSDSSYPCTQNPADISRNGHLVPMKSFVHEVLRRSRTSTGVLQTALCYLEAIRSKIPDVVCREKEQPGLEEQLAESTPRIIQGDILMDYDDALDGVPAPNLQACSPSDLAALDTVRTDLRLEDSFVMQEHVEVSDSSGVLGCGIAPSSFRSQPPLPPLPPQPSPLLCPRRTFLACLILASKFMQDRSYSNRAWAKLAGLPPREIGRCERAVGAALEWRLWVGKGVGSPATGGSVSNGRVFARSRSDADLLNGPNGCAARPAGSTADSFGTPCGLHVCSPATAGLPTPVQTPSDGVRRLRRCATEPAVSPGPSNDASNSYYTSSASTASYCGMDECEGLATGKVEPYVTFYAAHGRTVGAQSDAGLPSPSMSTPTLSYSPMSSTSSSSSDSSGDRTIQMSSFTDLPTPAPASFAFGPLGTSWGDLGVVEGTYGGLDWKMKGKTMYDGTVDQMNNATAATGLVLPAIDPFGATQVPFNLPSLSHTFSFAPNNGGPYNCWTR